LNDLRTFNGISGFLSRKESVHDIFGAGHASTSISAACGFALASDLEKKDEKIVAVIGDGGLTGGMAFEAMNHIGDIQKKLIVVLNDNEISIARNVGAISRFLSKKYTGYTITKVKSEIKSLLGYMKGTGENLLNVLRKLESSFKSLISSGILFESFGFHYLGPIDGHDINELLKYLRIASEYNGPVLLHINTQKGFGYDHAEKDPFSYHGVEPFNIKNGESLSTKKKETYTKCFSKEMCVLGAEDTKLVAITAAMPNGTGLIEFGELFPERMFDVGICEQHAVTYAAGLAASGFKPVVAIYSTFLQRSYDQIIHDVCLQNLPVIFALDRAGIVGEDGPTHNGVFDLSYLRSIPNITILAPANGDELKSMLRWAVKCGEPVAVRYPRGVTPNKIQIANYSNNISYCNSDSIDRSIHASVSEVIYQRSATDFKETAQKKVKTQSKGNLLILAVGQVVYPSLEAAQKIIDLDVTVVNIKVIKPLDKVSLIPLIRKSDWVVTVEDNLVQGGMGSAVLEMMSEEKISKLTKIIGIPDRFLPVGSQDQIRDLINLDSEGIFNQIFSFLDVVVKGPIHSIQKD